MGADPARAARRARGPHRPAGRRDPVLLVLARRGRREDHPPARAGAQPAGPERRGRRLRRSSSSRTARSARTSCAASTTNRRACLDGDDDGEVDLSSSTPTASGRVPSAANPSLKDDHRGAARRGVRHQDARLRRLRPTGRARLHAHGPRHRRPRVARRARALASPKARSPSSRPLSARPIRPPCRDARTTTALVEAGVRYSSTSKASASGGSSGGATAPNTAPTSG